MKDKISLREVVKIEDIENVRKIVASTGYFSDEEVNIAVELVKDRLEKGESSGYYFLFLEISGRTVGYSCFGPIPATKFSYDLYWIAIDIEYQNRGLGRLLLKETENEIERMGGNRIYIETSGRDQYSSTREFYLACNYFQESVLKDFYAPSDSKYIYLKLLS